MEARLSIVLRAALVAAAAFTVAASNPPSGDGATAARFDSAIARAKADMLVDPRRTLEDTRAAGWIAATVPAGAARDRMDATVLWLTGEAYARDNQAVRALPLLMEARAKAGSVAVGSQLQADILLSQGSALIDANRITEALPTLQRAHELFRQLGQPRSQAKALILIALLYDGAQDRESALRYFSRAIDAYAADPGLSMSIYIGRGNTLLGLGRLTQAENDFGRAEALAYKIGSIGTAAIALGNLAHVRLEQGHLDAADAAIARGLALSRRSEAALTHDVFVELAARSAFEHGQLSRAEALITQRFRGIDLTRTILTDRSAHEAAYRIYAALGDTPHALAHLAALKRLDDQATAVARSNTAALASAQFDYANQELRIAKLKADDLQKNIAFERAAARTQLYIFVGAALATALVIALLAFGLFTIRRSRDKVRAANADLADSNVALEKALAAKTEFLATTSHEIRTPLNGILGMTQVMIADGALDAATRDRLAVVHGAGVTMRALVDDILDVAKIETGKMTIETARLDLAATIEDACRMWREQARGQGAGVRHRP